MSTLNHFKSTTQSFFSSISFRKEYIKGIAMSIFFILISCCLYASPMGYPLSFTTEKLLEDLLSGEYNPKLKAVKWTGSPSDIYEFNGQLGEDRAFYSFVDTTLVVKREGGNLYFVVFRTAPMLTNDEGDFVNANSCHVCGVNLGYFSYIIENDSIYIQKFKRNFATQGSFGERTYALSIVNLGDGYELLKIDDPYEGMGIRSVTTKFYQDGELILSMISKEDNRGNRTKSQKGYYEFDTKFTYDKKEHSIEVSQIGYEIDETSGKRKGINKSKKLNFDSYTLQF